MSERGRRVGPVEPVAAGLSAAREAATLKSVPERAGDAVMSERPDMTVYCLVELDAVNGGPAAGGSLAVADASLRALTVSRELATSASRPALSAQAAPPASASRPAPTVAAVVFADAASVPVADLAAYGVTDIFAVSGGGYAPQAWARAIAGLGHSEARLCADKRAT